MDKRDLDMLRSCYAYGYLGWSNYYLDLVAKYGKNVVEDEVKKLQNKYDIKRDVYEDGEGCAYNSLVEKTIQ